MDFSNYFYKGDDAHGNFLSRFLGIFNEEIARIYFRSGSSKYIDLGRPTIKESVKERGATLDFTLSEKNSGKNYITEMKCEMAFQNYKYLELNTVEDIEHHVSYSQDQTKIKAFIRFLDCANNANKYSIEVNTDTQKSKKEQIKTDGIILIWGKVTKDTSKIETIKEKYHFTDILSLEDMINEMIKNNCKEYHEYICNIKNWVDGFLDGITTA